MVGNRIKCCNPACRRTAAEEKHPGSSEIICSKCWKLLPKRLTSRYRQLRRRDNKGIRLAEKKYAAGRLTDRQIDECERMAHLLVRKNWTEITMFFKLPQEPENLSSFLDEGFLR